MIITETKADLIREYYSAKKEGNTSSEILGWENKEAHYRRFDILKKVLHSNPAFDQSFSILDIGSGLGDLYCYLDERLSGFDYTGIDLLPEMTSRAKTMYPEAHFLCGDIFKDNLFSESSFDFIFSSGVFNINLGNNYTFLAGAVKKMVQLSRKYVIFNCLSNESKDMEDTYFYYDAKIIADIIGSTSGVAEFKLIDGYLHNDVSAVIRIH